MSGQEGLGDRLLLDALPLGRRSEHVHVAATEHGRGVGILSASVGVQLSVEHKDFDVGTVLQNHLRGVLIADVSHAAIAADGPHLWQLKHFLIGHQCIAEVREFVVFARGDNFLFALEQRIGEPLRNDGAPCVIRR